MSGKKVVVLFFLVVGLTFVATYFAIVSEFWRTQARLKQLKTEVRYSDLEIAGFEVDKNLFLKGEFNFKTRCGDCHGMQGQGTMNGVPLKDKNWIYGSDFSTILNTIKNGGQQMPAWKDRLQEEELIALAVYVRSLSKHP